MKLGPIVIYRQRKTANGLTIHPWHRVTEDRLAPEVREIVAKMARSVVKDLIEEQRYRLMEDLADFYLGLTTSPERGDDTEEEEPE